MNAARFKIFLIIFFMLLSFHIFSQRTDTGRSKGEIPNVVFFPFTASSAVGNEVAGKVLEDIAKSMLNRKSFNPFSLTAWLDQEYVLEKAKNMDQILNRARELKYPAQFFCEGTVFKCETNYAVIVVLYPLDDEIYTSYYLRYFSGPELIPKYADEIVVEMEKRSNRYKVEENLFDKSFFIEKISPKLFFKPPVSIGEQELTIIPALNINGVDYKDTDHFFNMLLAYNLHIFRLFDIKYSSTNSYLINNPAVPKDVDYTISLDISATDKFTLIRFLVFDEKNEELLFYYEYPFGSLKLEELNTSLKKNALVMVSRILNEADLKKVGIVNLNIGNSDTPVFFKDYYLGKGSQENVLLPFGLNVISVGTTGYLKFVLPFALSKYTGDEELLSNDLLKLLR